MHQIGYWRESRQQHPRELKHFFRVLDRVRRSPNHPGCIWPRTIKGFNSFLKAIGPKPAFGDFVVGRKNHDLPYKSGNLFWQDRIDNICDQDHSLRNSESYRRMGNKSALKHGKYVGEYKQRQQRRTT